MRSRWPHPGSDVPEAVRHGPAGTHRPSRRTARVRPGRPPATATPRRSRRSAQIGRPRSARRWRAPRRLRGGSPGGPRTSTQGPAPSSVGGGLVRPIQAQPRRSQPCGSGSEVLRGVEGGVPNGVAEDADPIWAGPGRPPRRAGRRARRPPSTRPSTRARSKPAGRSKRSSSSSRRRPAGVGPDLPVDGGDHVPVPAFSTRPSGRGHGGTVRRRGRTRSRSALSSQTASDRAPR